MGRKEDSVGVGSAGAGQDLPQVEPGRREQNRKWSQDGRQAGVTGGAVWPTENGTCPEWKGFSKWAGFGRGGPGQCGRATPRTSPTGAGM